ncbi:MAG TPA: hypothetical protein VFR81_15580 [Longimicrobium sp.]|nr:hypothetical protein [Longimicrobium sp.]
MSALGDLGVAPSELTPDEVDVVRELVGIGERATESYPGADTQQASQCQDCERLHANKSLLQRYAGYLTTPSEGRQVHMVGAQFLDLHLGADAQKTVLETITRAVVKRVVTEMERRLVAEFPPKFEGRGAGAGGPLKYARPDILFASDAGGTYYKRVAGPTEPPPQRSTNLPHVLEHVLLNLDLFCARLLYWLFAISSESTPRSRVRL